MTLEILLRDTGLIKIENVCKVSNQSSNFANDHMLIYCFNQPTIRPKLIKMSNVVCWEVKP